MQTATSSNTGGSGPRDPRSPRTLTPNGPLIRLLRQSEGWSRADFEIESHYAVERAASTSGCNRRLKARHDRAMRLAREGKLAGLCVSVLASVENSTPAYPLTLLIVALTLGVLVADIIIQDDPDPAPGPSSGSLEITPLGIERILQGLAGLSPEEKAVALRRILNTLKEP